MAAAHGPGQGHGAGTCAVRIPYVAQQRLVNQLAVAQRAIGHDGHTMVCAPGQQLIFNAATADVVEHLIDRTVTPARHLPQLLHIVGVKVGDTPVANLASGLQDFQRRNRLRQRRMATPVQQVQVNAVHAQPLAAEFKRAHHPLTAGIHGQHLADQKRLRLQRGPVPQGVANQLFGQAIAIHLGRVDQCHAQLQAGQQGGLFSLPAASALTQIPAAHAQTCMRLQKRQSVLRGAQAHGISFKNTLQHICYVGLALSILLFWSALFPRLSVALVPHEGLRRHIFVQNYLFFCFYRFSQ